MATKKSAQLQASIPLAGDDPPARDLPALEILPLDRLLGQRMAVGTLQTAMSGRRLHHAWIFHGPQGVGKFTAAVSFAAYLLDTTLEPDLSGALVPDPDGITQRLIRAGTHPDLHIVTKELAKVSRKTQIHDSKQISIPKEVVEEYLTEPAARTRVQIGPSIAGKVFIVDEAELLNHVSQNLLLKTLEEPPAGTIIILVTSNEDRLFPTIRSRCQRVRFGTLEEAEMRAWMKRRPISPSSADEEAWLLRFAAGSPGLLQLALDNNLLVWHEALSPMLSAADQGRYSFNFGSTMHQLVDAQAAAWVKKFPDASKDAANKAWAKRLFGYLGEHYRACMTSAASGAGSGSGGVGGVGGGIGVGRCIVAIDAVAQAEEYLNTNVNMQFVFENLAVKLCAERRA